MLEVINLKKSFGDQVVWDDLNCHIKPGEIVSIQGKSGEGKTTFLRCLNGLESIDSGQILINGQSLEDMEQGREKILGLVFQGYQLFPHLNVWDNITLAPRYHDMQEDIISDNVNKLLKDLDLYEHKDKLPSQLSGGQQQRVAIARACMLSPDILCFDEPTSALDEGTRDHIIDIIKKLSEEGMTILIVTHDRVFAENVSDRILHIKNGKFNEQIIKDPRP